MACGKCGAPSGDKLFCDDCDARFARSYGGFQSAAPQPVMWKLKDKLDYTITIGSGARRSGVNDFDLIVNGTAQGKIAQADSRSRFIGGHYRRGLK